MSDTHNTTIEDDVEERDVDLGPLDDSDAEDAFLVNLRGADEATDEQDDDEDTETDAETGASDNSEAGDDEAPAPTSEKQPAAPVGDDALVEVKVGEDTHRVAVRDLKRLFGQEAALTRRSQEVASERTALQQEAERTKTVLQKALERAEAKAKPYAEMDFWKLSRELDGDTFEEVRRAAREAFDEVNFLRTEMDEANQTISRSAQAAQASAAQACVKELTDKNSPHYVEGWGAPLYQEILGFARDQGFDASKVTDPAAIKMIRMAMLYERGRTVVRTKVKKVAEQPKTPLRPGSAGGASPTQRADRAAVTRLRNSGSAEDAEAAFMARLRPRDDD